MSGQFMKKCSQCGKYGAAFKSTNAEGVEIQLCSDCRKTIMDNKGGTVGADASKSPK